MNTELVGQHQGGIAVVYLPGLCGSVIFGVIEAEIGGEPTRAQFTSVHEAEVVLVVDVFELCVVVLEGEALRPGVISAKKIERVRLRCPVEPSVRSGHSHLLVVSRIPQVDSVQPPRVQ
ncbi:hypothetical protein D3C76_1111450 [compost metagenome]